MTRLRWRSALTVLVVGCTARHAPLPGSAALETDGALMTAQDMQRLQTIVEERASAPALGGYRIGPDDLLDIRIPDLAETGSGTPVVPSSVGAALAAVAEAPVFQQGVRVDAVGFVAVPFVGAMPAAGRTPAMLADEIGKRLVAAGILRDPQITVQVVEHRSGVVAVVGSVERPGLYPLTRPEATLADLIWAAGGPNKDAGRVVNFVPAPPATSSTRQDVAPDLGRLARGEAIRVDLNLLLEPSAVPTLPLNPKMRPGDVVSIAAAGTVQVDGWVVKPGSYPITRALTVLGAVAAAGGQLYAADCGHVTVTRTASGSEQRSLEIDLDAVTKGQTADVPVLDGDVVHLPASIPRMIPYGAWELVKAVVHVGGSVALF